MKESINHILILILSIFDLISFLSIGKILLFTNLLLKTIYILLLLIYILALLYFVFNYKKFKELSNKRIRSIIIGLFIIAIASVN